MAGKHDHGCKRVMHVPADWKVDGEISDCEQYRYKLSQRWAGGPLALFCMMNPSGADLDVTDATVSKCARMATGWGYGVAGRHHRHRPRSAAERASAPRRYYEPKSSERRSHFACPAAPG